MFVVKLFLFCTLTYAILDFFFLPYAPDVGKEIRYVDILNRSVNQTEDFDLAIFGNSFAYTAYDPSIFKTQLNLNAIHINSSSQRLMTSLIVADYVLKKSDFRFIVFDVSSSTLTLPSTSDEKEWFWQTLGLQEVPFSFVKTSKAFSYFPFVEYPEYFITSLTKKVSRIFRLNMISNYEKRNENEFFRSALKNLFTVNGFLAYRPAAMKKDKFLKILQSRPRASADENLLWSDKLKKMTKELLKKAKKKNIDVIFVNGLTLYEQDYDTEFIDRLLLENKNLKFIDFNTEKNKYELNEQSFYNANHLNYSGSYQVTSRLVDSLKNWYKIDFDETQQFDFGPTKLNSLYFNLSQDQEKFIKLEFDSIPHLLKNYNLVVSLYPNSVAAPKVLKNKNLSSDNFYFRPLKDNITVKNSEIFVKKLGTKITEENLERIKIYFYKAKDSLSLPSFNRSYKTNF